MSSDWRRMNNADLQCTFLPSLWVLSVRSDKVTEITKLRNSSVMKKKLFLHVAVTPNSVDKCTIAVIFP